MTARLFQSFLLAGILVLWKGADTMASDDFGVDPGSDFGGPHHSFIELQLAPALIRLTQVFEKEAGFPIEVYRRTDFPKVDLVNGVQRIGVTASEGFWMRYTYEFSHELGHVLTNWQLEKNYSHKWFEETISELASIYVIGSYAADPPSSMFTTEQWRDYLATNRSRYGEQRFEVFRIPPGAKAASWFPRVHSQMEKNSTIRSLNAGIAYELLPHFLEKPSLWKGCGYLNLWDTSENESFRDYLSSWILLLAQHGQEIETVQLVSRVLYGT